MVGREFFLPYFRIGQLAYVRKLKGGELNLKILDRKLSQTDAFPVDLAPELFFSIQIRHLESLASKRGIGQGARYKRQKLARNKEEGGGGGNSEQQES